MIAVIGSAGTIGRHVAASLEEWGADVVRRDFRLGGDEYVDARDSASLSRTLDGVAVVVNCADYRLNLYVMRGAAAAGHPFPAPYSVQTLRDELQMRPIIVVDGELTEVQPLSGAAEREFPEPVGRAKGIYALHSELATLPTAYPSLREASFRLCLAPGLLEKLLALGEGDLPEPYVQSPESVAVHQVEMRLNGSVVVGTALTRGESAKSTSEPAARAAVELAEGRPSAPGTSPPEQAIEDPEGFLGLLDTEVRWTS